MRCKWKSKLSHKICNREEFDDSGYCIYHKPNKDIFEGALFWGLMNYSYDNYDSKEMINTLFGNLQQLRLLDELEFDLEDSSDKKEIKHKFLDYSEEEFYNYFFELLREKDVINAEMDYIDFSGFCFPNEPFNKIAIDNYSLENNRVGHILFYENIFEGEANFQYLTFRQNVHFKNTDFNLSVNFSHSTFEQKCIFENVIFNDIYPISTISSFWKTNFEGLLLIFKNIPESISIDGINLSENTSLIFENTHFSINNLREGERAYRIAKQQALKSGDTEIAGKYYYLERIYKGRKILPKLNYFEEVDGKRKFVLFKNFFKLKIYRYLIPKLGDQLSKITIGYGEKPWRILSFSLIIIVIFSFIFMFNGLKFNGINSTSEIIRYHLNMPAFYHNIISNNTEAVSEFITNYGNFLYFSIATFTTVGYGDIIPYNFLGRVFAATEMLLGITLTGIWVALLLRKMLK